MKERINLPKMSQLLKIFAVNLKGSPCGMMDTQ